VNGAWVYDSTLHAADAAADDSFGSSVSAYGDHVLIKTDISQKVYLFRRTASGWVQDARYTNPGAVGDVFGSGTAVGSGQLVAGAWGYDTPNFSNMGCTYIYD